MPQTHDLGEIQTLFSPAAGIRHTGCYPRSCCSCWCWTPRTPCSCLLHSPSSWFLGHTPFPPKWLGPRPPLTPVGWHRYPAVSGSWHHRTGMPTSLAWLQLLPQIHSLWSHQHLVLAALTQTQGREWEYTERLLRKDLIRMSDRLWWSGTGLGQTSMLISHGLHAAIPFYACFSLILSLFSPYPLLLNFPS